MTFSILSPHGAPPETAEQPECFHDLNLDQVVEAITAGRDDYNLKPFFHTPLHDPDIIRYRQDVLRDLHTDAALLQNMRAFAEKMTRVRRWLGMAAKLDFAHHKNGWILDAARLYCQAVRDLDAALGAAQTQSSGFDGLRRWVQAYVQGQAFTALEAEAQAVKSALGAVKYSIIIQPGRFSVRKYEDEADYSVQVEATFEKFKQGAVKDYLSTLNKGTGMNHIEAKILEFVARLFPEPFAALDAFCAAHANFLDDTLHRFDREVQFYLAHIEYTDQLREKGLPVCFPEVTETREVYAREAFDPALAGSLLYTATPVICNDFDLRGPERVIVVTGPNQGGKTTFARMFGQIHYLASLGLTVPGRAARLALFDQIYTHFEREEDIRSLSGKLQDDLTRIHAILERATPRSILILNEIFSSTTLKDALFLSREIMTRLLALDALGVWVTFIDELAAFSEKTVSMASTVVPDNPAERTFRIIRKPADGLAYALSLAEKHRLTYQHIKERIQP